MAPANLLPEAAVVVVAVLLADLLPEAAWAVVRTVGIWIGAPGHAGEVQASALGVLKILVVRGRGGHGGEGHKQEGEDKRLGTIESVFFVGFEELEEYISN